MVKDKYKVGDVVQLKSGGPRMTISSVPRGPDPSIIGDKGKSQYGCNWFKGGTLERGSFAEELLIPVAQEKEKTILAKDK